MSDCEFKHCRSGLPAKVQVNENLDDGCWSVSICRNCAEYFNLKNGDDIHDTAAINTQLRQKYATKAES